MLNATLDTAEFGDPAAWTHEPLSGCLRRGWLYGRGSADSKAGVVIFSHVLAALALEPSGRRGTMAFVFDVDEHSGAFSGIRRWLAAKGRGRTYAGAMIGYPGEDRIVAGCRGFHRASITVHGVAAHSGSSRQPGVNAISRAAALIDRLERAALPEPQDDTFPLPPQLTVTGIHGGGSFSSVPDRCLIDVDVRLTPAFTAASARSTIASAVRDLDRLSEAAATDIRHIPGWPAYRLPGDAPVLQALAAAAQRVLGRTPPVVVVGPSSVGNFLAARGIGATSGFGVRYRNLHAADECIAVASLAPAYHTYLTAARTLLA